MPANYSSYMGNDDHAAWGHAAMTAAELEFPHDPSMPTWISLAENVWKLQVQRWDTESCDGGLRSAFYPYQNTYTFKDASSNGLLFELSARLARYTSNQTYADWAEKIWDWSSDTLLHSKNWTVSDRADLNHDCKPQGDEVWSRNYGPYISGAAYMFNVVSLLRVTEKGRGVNRRRQTATKPNGNPVSMACSTRRSILSSRRSSAARSCPR